MTKGKPREHLGKRTGSRSNNASRASASDRRHDEQQVEQGKSFKAGTEQRGKIKDSQGGSKR